VLRKAVVDDVVPADGGHLIGDLLLSQEIVKPCEIKRPLRIKLLRESAAACSLCQKRPLKVRL
jgi:hypothetical protein